MSETSYTKSLCSTTDIVKCLTISDLRKQRMRLVGASESGEMTLKKTSQEETNLGTFCLFY